MAGCRAMAAALIAFWTASGWADVREIGVLRQEFMRLSATVDSLKRQRLEVRAEAEELSTRIDSLKGQAGDEGLRELHESLRASLVLVQRLVGIEQELVALQARQDSLKEQLRLAYDWEIGMLIQRLTRQPDPGLLTQLMVYQEDREALGVEPINSSLRYGEEMSIRPEDGPEEIRQKVELMEGISARLRAESRKTLEQLRRLEEEQRLRSRVQVFASEMNLFDEHLPEGRALVRTERPNFLSASSPAEDAEREELKSFEVVDREGGVSQGLLIYRESSTEARVAPLEGLRIDDVALEIRKLKAHLQELRQLEELANERAITFRAYLEKLLEGEE